MDIFMLQRMGIIVYTAARLALFAGLLIGTAPAVMATNPESMLLAMSLFSQDPPAPTLAKPKPPVAAKPPGAVANVAPGAGPLVPGTVRPAQNDAISQTSAAAPPAPINAVPQAPGVARPTPIDTAPNPSAGAKPAVPGLASTAPSPVGPSPVPTSPSPAGRALEGGAAGLGIPISLPDGYSYDSKGRRDPFQSMVKLLKMSQSRGELPPLQRLELSDVKLMGIVSDASGYYGLIQTPDGKGYTVRVGTPMGTNNGTIKLISEQRVVVAEPAIDSSGKMTTRDIEILQRPKEGTE
jgi:type IV pilus assembly protein PilP